MNKKLVYIIGISVISVLVFFSIVGILIFLFYTFLNQPDNNSSEDEHPLLSQDVSPGSDSNSVNYGIGLVHLNRKLKDEEYFNYYNPETERTVLISNFGGKEYECTGKCFCEAAEESEDRRSASVLISRGLTVIVTAVTAAMASKMAMDVFDDECFWKYDPKCKKTPDEIEEEMKQYKEPEVDRCAEREIHDHLDWTDGEKAYFTCWGHCVVHDSYAVDYARIASDNDVNCKSLRIESTEVIVRKEEAMKMEAMFWLTQFAKQRFIQEHLDPFCIAQSKVPNFEMSTYELKREEGVSDLVPERDTSEGQFVCSGYLDKQVNMESHENVNCAFNGQEEFNPVQDGE